MSEARREVLRKAAQRKAGRERLTAQVRAGNRKNNNINIHRRNQLKNTFEAIAFNTAKNEIRRYLSQIPTNTNREINTNMVLRLINALNNTNGRTRNFFRQKLNKAIKTRNNSSKPNTTYARMRHPVYIPMPLARPTTARPTTARPTTARRPSPYLLSPTPFI